MVSSVIVHRIRHDEGEEEWQPIRLPLDCPFTKRGRQSSKLLHLRCRTSHPSEESSCRVSPERLRCGGGQSTVSSAAIDEPAEGICFSLALSITDRTGLQMAEHHCSSRAGFPVVVSLPDPAPHAGLSIETAWYSAFVCHQSRHLNRNGVGKCVCLHLHRNIWASALLIPATCSLCCRTKQNVGDVVCRLQPNSSLLLSLPSTVSRRSRLWLPEPYRSGRCTSTRTRHCCSRQPTRVP